MLNFQFGKILPLFSCESQRKSGSINVYIGMKSENFKEIGAAFLKLLDFFFDKMRAKR